MPLPLLSTIGPIAKMVGGMLDKAIPDKDLKEKLKHELNTQLINGEHEELIAKSRIIQAEAESYVESTYYWGGRLYCWKKWRKNSSKMERK